MKDLREATFDSKNYCKTYSDSPNIIPGSVCSESGSSDSKLSKTSLWSGFFLSAFSIFETHGESNGCANKGFTTGSHGWTEAVKRVMNGGSMRRIQERVLGLNKTGISSSTNDIWLLGVCYKISQEDSSRDPAISDRASAFVEDFSSRILLTYRKGFVAIGDSKYTSDVNWGCMLRSSQMLVAQALIVHHLGRSWRKTFHEPLDKEYIQILHHFGDSEASAFSIHNLLQAGNGYDLSAGSWVGPYTMCRTWESLARCKREENKLEDQSFPMAIYIVSGDENGERGGAPVVCIEDASRYCLELSKGQANWTPILLLVPLVLGLDKVNPRYIPLLGTTFTFPQSLGILGGRPGASTYIVGVQDGEALFLDPHEVQQVVDIGKNDSGADTSSYHCNVVRRIPLDSIDPSLAIGFYCRDKDDFDDFCNRASKLADESKGAPLFTVTSTRKMPKAGQHDTLSDSGRIQQEESLDVVSENNEEGCKQEDDWQLL